MEILWNLMVFNVDFMKSNGICHFDTDFMVIFDGIFQGRSNFKKPTK